MSSLFKFLILKLILLTFSVSVYGNIVASSTRIVYPGNAKSKTFLLTNYSDHPNIVQVWIDKDQFESGSEREKVPFLVTPPIFKISANAGQSVKIIYDGTPLPTDRESIFYFNFLQIPSEGKSTSSEASNKVTLLFRHTLKLFYRPPGIKEDSRVVTKYQQFSLQREDKHWNFKILNNSGFYVTYTGSFIELKNGEKVALDIGMLEPYSEKVIAIPLSKISSNSELSVYFSLISDHGGKLEETILIKH